MNTALIIVDMQKGFINEHTKDLVPKIVDFVNSNSFSLVVGTKYINNMKTACYRFEGWTDCMEGSESSELVKEIDDICDVVTSKSKYSCWDEHMLRVLRTFNINRLVFCGVNTGCCVLASVFGAYDDVWDVTVIEDLCASTSGVASHEAGVRILKECITNERVVTSKEYNNG